VLSFGIGQVSRMKKIRSCCWKELRVFRVERWRRMRWLGKVVFPEQGSMRELMKTKRSLSENSSCVKDENPPPFQRDLWERDF
jgi:hypothetical protein